MNRTRLGIGAAIGGAALAALLPATAAVSDESPPAIVIDVELHDAAVLRTRGAVAVVGAQMTCTPGASAYVSVQLTQHSGSGIAQGYANTQVTCNGTIQELDLAVTAGAKAFKQGPAFAEVTGSVFDFSGFTQDTDAEEISLVKRR